MYDSSSYAPTPMSLGFRRMRQAANAHVVIGYLSNDARAKRGREDDRRCRRQDLCHSPRLSERSNLPVRDAQKAVGTLDIVVVNAADFIVRPPAENYDRTFDTAMGIPSWTQFGIENPVVVLRGGLTMKSAALTTTMFRVPTAF